MLVVVDVWGGGGPDAGSSFSGLGGGLPLVGRVSGRRLVGSALAATGGLPDAGASHDCICGEGGFQKRMGLAEPGKVLGKLQGGMADLL